MKRIKSYIIISINFIKLTSKVLFEIAQYAVQVKHDVTL